MQEHTPKRIRVSVLLFLLLLSLLSPLLIREYEERTAFKWEVLVQPRWEAVNEQPSPTIQPEDMASEDFAEWKDIPVQQMEITPEQKIDAKAAMPAAVKIPDKKPVPARMVIPEKKSTPRKSSALQLKLPENIHQGHLASWEEKKPVTIPDLFAPKPDNPGRVQLSGKLIVDEEKKKEQPDADYLDTVKGAEINISIKTD